MTGAVSFVVKIFTEASASVALMVVTALNCGLVLEPQIPPEKLIDHAYCQVEYIPPPLPPKSWRSFITSLHDYGVPVVTGGSVVTGAVVTGAVVTGRIAAKFNKA